MPRKFDKAIESIKKDSEKQKKNVEEFKSEVSNCKKRKTDDQISRLEAIADQLTDELEELRKRLDVLEQSYLTQLKAVYSNSYFIRRSSGDPQSASGKGLYNPAREAIYPHSDSLFL